MSIQNFFRTGINDMRFHSIPRMILRILDNFFHDSCLIRASGLAFNSLLALVPLSAVLFAFGGLNSVSSELQNFLVDILLPTSLNQILGELNVFTENATRLGTYGIILFLITVLLLMNNIENNLNAIWHCKRKRGFFQQLTIYTTVIVFASLLIGGNFSISGSFLAILPDYKEALKEPFILQFFFRMSSILFITLTFLLLIILIPSTKVSFKSALTGALTGAILWELAKWGFKTWANYSVRNSVIYGSLFLIPLLLVWLYVVWLIIMITMETAYVHQHRNEPHSRYKVERKSSEQFNLLLETYLTICRLYLQTDKRGTIERLASITGRNEEEINEGTAALLREKFIIRSDEGCYFPAKAPEKIAIAALYSSLSGLNGTRSTSVESFIHGGENMLNKATVSDLIRDNDNSDAD